MEIPTITNQRNFLIKIEESGIPMIEEYKQALAKNTLNEDMESTERKKQPVAPRG